MTGWGIRSQTHAHLITWGIPDFARFKGYTWQSARIATLCVHFLTYFSMTLYKLHVSGGTRFESPRCRWYKPHFQQFLLRCWMSRLPSDLRFSRLLGFTLSSCGHQVPVVNLPCLHLYPEDGSSMKGEAGKSSGLVSGGPPVRKQDK
jgi:hypothetical protein